MRVTELENENELETLIILNPPSRQVEHLYKDNVSDEDLKNLIFQTQRFLQLVWNKRKKLRKHVEAPPGFGKPDGHKSIRTSKPNTQGKNRDLRDMFSNMPPKRRPPSKEETSKSNEDTKELLSVLPFSVSDKDFVFPHEKKASSSLKCDILLA